MDNKFIIERLKGGSLSETLLYRSQSESFVRKTISLTENREYGFQRWYSQLKKIQRFNVDYPNLFPNLLNYGLDGDNAYFDIEYFENSKNLYEILCKDIKQKEINKIFSLLIESFEGLHDEKICSFDSAIELYFREEIVQKINDCLSSSRFKNILEKKYLIYNGEKITGVYWELDNYMKLFSKTYINKKDCFTHGNSTLENILYDSSANKIIFIDPYEENIIDSKFAEYSQILQSCSSKYEYLNNIKTKFDSKGFTFIDNFPHNLKKFNEMFNLYLRKLTESDYILVRLFEISQFIRMLPFKKDVNEEKMLFFYAHASFLYKQLLSEI